MVGANCHGSINDISINDGKDVEQGNDGVRAGLGTAYNRWIYLCLYAHLVPVQMRMTYGPVLGGTMFVK